MEQDLEKALINDIQDFLLELGKGFAFVERQQLVRTETSDFYIDLVFYNYLLKCVVIIELKTEKLTHKHYSGLIDLDTLIVDNTIINRGEYEYKTSISNLYERI
ncbi:PDDEXK nuclease domain-containing protein [Vibrio sp. S11_S32]|uniref:PDDEXK nuclease domain-containing protein n=1 Tax=Vibrio sp. S11_S32 TaxID=2720225 RepID=UPI00406CC79C